MSARGVVGRPAAAVAGGIHAIGRAAVMELAVEAVGPRHVGVDAGIAPAAELCPGQAGQKDGKYRDSCRGPSLMAAVYAENDIYEFTDSFTN